MECQDSNYGEKKKLLHHFLYLNRSYDCKDLSLAVTQVSGEGRGN